MTVTATNPQNNNDRVSDEALNWHFHMWKQTTKKTSSLFGGSESIAGATIKYGNDNGQLFVLFDNICTFILDSVKNFRSKGLGGEFSSREKAVTG